MKLISQDYCFENFSLTCARFIVDCNDMYPTGAITEVKYIFPLKTGFSYLNFQSPEDTATWLKLKYGGALVERPEPPKPNSNSTFDNLRMMKKKSISSSRAFYDFESSFDKNVWNSNIWDTPKTLKEYDLQKQKQKKDQSEQDNLKSILDAFNDRNF